MTGSGASLVGLPGGTLASARALRQVPFALALALTRTAQDVQAESKRLMRSKISNPRAFTLNAVAIVATRKGETESRVFFRETAGKDLAAGRYLKPLEFGGPRGPKRAEMAMRRAGILKGSELLVPIAGGYFDAERPGLGGRWTELLSAMRANPDALANRTDRSAARARAKARLHRSGDKRFATYFRKGNAIFRRTSKRRAAPVLVVTRGATYRRSLGFAEMAVRVSRERLPRQWALAMGQALATAR